MGAYCSTTVYATLALGASNGLGFFYIPKGYSGVVLTATAFLSDSPGNTTGGVSFKLGQDFGCSLSLGNGHEDIGKYRHVESEGTQIRYQGRYKTAMTAAEIHSYIAIWA